MSNRPPSTRDRLIQAAVALFQERGYHGTSIADLLAAAEAPKGSLYHHFPKGKPDIAEAAADATSQLMLDLVARAFDPATDLDQGTRRLTDKLVRLFEKHPHWRACPVQTLLIDGPLGGERGDALLRAWIDATAAQAARLGAADPDLAARHLWSTLIGCWTLARAADDAAPLRDLPKLLGTAPAAPG